MLRYFIHSSSATAQSRSPVPETLITFLVSETSYLAEVELLEEMKALGAATMVIANRVDDRARRASDFAIEIGPRSPEYACSAAFAIWGQLYGVYYGLKKGLNPDSPKNLTRVVELADEATKLNITSQRSCVQFTPMPTFDITIAGEINLDLILYGLPEQMPTELEFLASGFNITLGSSSAILAHNLLLLAAAWDS